MKFHFGRNVPTPCKDCLDRTMTCHAVCQAYKAYREEQDRMIEVRLLEKQSEPMLTRAVQKRVWKGLKGR